MPNSHRINTAVTAATAQNASGEAQNANNYEGTCYDVKLLEQRINQLTERLDVVVNAFPRTSVGTPAFDKHRDYHEEQEQKETRVKQIQHEITKKIIVVVFGALLSALLSGYSDDIFRILKQVPFVSREIKEQTKEKVITDDGRIK